MARGKRGRGEREIDGCVRGSAGVKKRVLLGTREEELMDNSQYCLMS